MTYFVGLLARKRKAVFQFRRTLDALDCEILEYCGERTTTKAQAKKQLARFRSAVLQDLNARYPGRNFKAVEVE